VVVVRCQLVEHPGSTTRPSRRRDTGMIGCMLEQSTALELRAQPKRGIWFGQPIITLGWGVGYRIPAGTERWMPQYGAGTGDGRLCRCFSRTNGFERGADSASNERAQWPRQRASSVHCRCATKVLYCVARKTKVADPRWLRIKWIWIWMYHYHISILYSDSS
jgi:hypothetical protein